MYISGIEKESLVDGPGIRVAIFFSGCKHACPGCHNPDTWNFNNGHEFTEEDYAQIEELASFDFIDGITLSGGDPLFSAEELIPYIQRFKKKYPNKTIWVFSGFVWERLLKDKDYKLKLISLCDVLVDGPFVESKKDYTQSFRGSTNQRFIDIKKSIMQKAIVEWTDTYNDEYSL